MYVALLALSLTLPDCLDTGAQHQTATLEQTYINHCSSLPAASNTTAVRAAGDVTNACALRTAYAQRALPDEP